MAIQTPFGWAIFESINTSGVLQEKKEAVNTTFTSRLNDTVKKSWVFDSKLDQQCSENGLSQDNRSYLNKLQKDTKLVNGHYEVWTGKNKTKGT